MADPPRILLFHENRKELDSLRPRLVHAGFSVTGVRDFVQAAPFLVAGRVDILVIWLPEVEWLRNAILVEVRRANPALPIVALSSSVSDGLDKLFEGLRVARALGGNADWRVLVGVIRQALSSTGLVAREPA